MRKIIDQAIRANFAIGDGTPDVWKLTLHRLLIHSHIQSDEEYDKLIADHELYRKQSRYRIKSGLVANFMKLHV
jgi:hypothetical protein